MSKDIKDAPKASPKKAETAATAVKSGDNRTVLPNGLGVTTN